MLTEAKKKADAKSGCSIHNCKLTECFYLHQLPEAEMKLRVPCGHLVDRPTVGYAVVECGCGKRWKLKLVEGGQAWNAQEAEL